MKRNQLTLLIALAIGSATVLPVDAAETISPDQLSELRLEREGLRNDFLQKEKQIETIKLEEQKYTEELKKLDDEVALVNERIRNLYNTIDLTGQVVNGMKEEIQELSERIENRDAMIKERLRTLQAQEGIKLYMHMLLDTKSFSQLFDVTSAISTIMKADQQLLDKHQKDLKLKIEQEEELKDSLVALEKDQKELQELKVDLEEKVTEKQKLLNAIKQEKEQDESELMGMYEIYVNLTEQEIAILKENQTERLEYLNSKPEDIFIRPAAGTMTSGYGPRWGDLHAGIDIADPSPEAKVVAAASGTVIRSYYSASYGNCVLITHKIGGQTFTTLYAHLEKSTVTTGQTINKGEMLGYMGNTGNSKGKHLHFEIHKGEWNFEKTNSIDPMTYLK